MAVSKRTRFEVLRRDDHRCRYCGRGAPDVPMTVDHVVPTALGGSDKPDNLVAACGDCNAGKSSVPPDASLVADVAEKAVEWGNAMSRVLEQRAAELADERQRLDVFDRRWRGWTFPGIGEMPRDPGWRSSVSQFMAAGLDDQWLADTVDKVVGLNKVSIDGKWKYFCGICWTEINKLIERATQVAGAPGAPVKAQPAELRDPPFDYMAMYEVLLEELVQASGAQPIIFNDLKWLIGIALPDAYQVWKETAAAHGDAEFAEEEAREQMAMSIAHGMWDVELWYATGRLLTDRYIAMVLEAAGAPPEGIKEAVENLSGGLLIGQMEFRRRMREDYPCEPEVASKHGEQAMRDHVGHVFEVLRQQSAAKH